MEIPFAGTFIDVRELKTPELLGWLKRIRYGDKTYGFAAVVAELKQRGVQHSALTYHAPDACRCGKPGLYRIRTTTYCHACLPEAQARLKRRAAGLEAALSEKEELFNRHDRRLRARDLLVKSRYGKRKRRR